MSADSSCQCPTWQTDAHLGQLPHETVSQFLTMQQQLGETLRSAAVEFFGRYDAKTIELYHRFCDVANDTVVTRHMDQIDADAQAWNWLTARGRSLGGDSIEKFDYMQEEGRVAILWHNNRPAALTVIFRDGLNFSYVVCTDLQRRNEILPPAAKDHR